jgi:asparagine synthase (glutamine-hydrolysing)
LSAIHGILRFDGKPVIEGDLVRQANALAHRGADRRTQWRGGAIGLGHLLRRVTNEDVYDSQPVRTGTNVLVADLRLDNRGPLTSELDIDDDTSSDSAILAAAYARWGEDCAQHLIGDFAFAIWDGAERTLILARDHMGQRHLHYHAGKGAFVFASEIAGLKAIADIPDRLDMSALARRIAVDRTPTRGATVFENIFGLEGGTVMRIRATGEIETRRFWEPHADPKHLNRDEAYYIRAYRETLAEAVGCRVRRVRQSPALLLGGGFDSGAIAGLAGPKTLVAVASVGSDETRGVRKWATLIARHMPHVELKLVTRDGIDVLTDVERNFLVTAEPHSPNRYAAEALTAVAAAGGARVLMDGHGGDYTLNPRGTGWLWRRLRRGQLALFWKEFGAFRRHNRAGWASAFKTEIAMPLAPIALARRWRRIRAGLPATGPAAPLQPALLAEAGFAELREQPRGRAPQPQMAEILRRQQSGNVIGGALLAAAYGMDFTQPYHDKRVVELALAIPESLFVKAGRDRHLARMALADVYPPQFQARGRGNDDLIPDFPAMAERTKPALMRQIDRMENDPTLAVWFDFARMRAQLSRPVTARNEAGARNAIRALLHARFIEWHSRRNR